jgi:hypothetical protein
MREVMAGLKGKSNKRMIPIAEVKEHCTEEDAWTVLRGRVYNISPYIRFHPGGFTYPPVHNFSCQILKFVAYRLFT